MRELSKPVAWEISNPGEGTYFIEHEPQAGDYRRDLIISQLYSQEYVSALLAELEAKDKRIVELEAKLATPVRLLGEMLPHQWERAERQAAFEHRKIAWDARLAEDKKAILAAGFTVEVGE